ncbi:MAG: type II secretion system protein [Rickettsiales bacterium]|nr:type II secretion system protein [Rickettsiales bacterium]
MLLSRCIPTKKFSRQGFTLLEMGIVLLILSLVTGTVMTFVVQQSRSQKQKDLATRLDAIESALISFRKANNRLPCPASLSAAISSTSFGTERATPGTCTSATFSTGDTVADGVPVRAIGLPDEFAFDPWGGRIQYAVDRRATGSNAFTTYTTSITGTTGLGSITVQDTTGANRTTSAIALIMSSGANGLGAYQANGTRRATLVDNSFEEQNCDCFITPPYSLSAGSYNATYVMAATSFGADLLGVSTIYGTTKYFTDFDDVVRYYTRGQFASATELLTETSK